MRSGRVSGAVTGLALLALAAAGAVPPPAIAATAWRAYQLAPNSESPKVAFDSHGTAIATWTQTFYGDFTTRSDVLAVRTKGVWKTQRLPDGFTVGNPVAFGRQIRVLGSRVRPGPRRQFRETVEVVASGGGRRHFQVLASQLGSGTSFQSLVLAANARGDAVAAWLEVTTNGGKGRVFAAFSRRGRQFSRPVRVSRGLGLNPSVAINGAGEALIAWRAQRVVLARDGRSRARLGRVIHIADAPGLAGTTAAAIGPDGRAVVAWYAGAAKPCGGNGETSYSLRVAARRSFSAPVELSHCLNTNAYRSTPVEAAFDSRGKAVIAWEAAGAAVATPKVVQIGPSGEGGAPTALGPAGADLKDLAVAGTAAAVSIVLDEGTLGGPPFTGRRHLLVSQLARGEFSSPHEVDVGGQVPGDAAAIAVNPVTRSALSVFEAGPRYPGPTGVDWAEGPAPTR